jgi:hypothetical protein
MPQPMIEPPILDETMIEPKTLPSNQDKSMTNHLPISYKRPRDNQIILIVPPKINFFNKYKDNLVEKPPMVPYIPPLRE